MGVLDHYSAGHENARMARDRNRVERARTREPLDRWLPPPPATALAAGRGVPAEVADARRLPAGDATADAVLLLGPLYHLPDPADRARALAEATPGRGGLSARSRRTRGRLRRPA